MSKSKLSFFIVFCRLGVDKNTENMLSSIQNKQKKRSTPFEMLLNLPYLLLESEDYLFHSCQVERNVAINGMGGANAADFKPSDGLQRESEAIIEV